MSHDNDISLRQAEPADDEFLFELFAASREREFAPLPIEVRQLVTEHQHRIYQSGVRAEFADARTFVILATMGPQVDPRPTGMIILADRQDALWVVDMALHPDHQNKGLGAAVLGALMDQCRRTGRVMRGSVTPYNPARRLYARLGVKEVGAERGYISLEWGPE